MSSLAGWPSFKGRACTKAAALPWLTSCLSLQTWWLADRHAGFQATSLTRSRLPRGPRASSPASNIILCSQCSALRIGCGTYMLLWQYTGHLCSMPAIPSLHLDAARCSAAVAGVRCPCLWCDAISAQQLQCVHATVRVCTLLCRNSGNCQCVLYCRGERSGAGWAWWPRLCWWVIGSLQITRYIEWSKLPTKSRLIPELPVPGWPGLGFNMVETVAQF